MALAQCIAMVPMKLQNINQVLSDTSKAMSLGK